MIVERQEFRNRNTTATVNAAPSMRASCTLNTESSTRTPASCTIRRRDAGRKRLLDLGDPLAGSASPTAVVLKPVDLRMSMPTASSSLYCAEERASSVASRTSARSPSRTMRPCDLRDRELLEIRRRIEPTLQADRALVQLPFEAAHRRRKVLRLQRLHDLPDADARRLKVARTNLDDQLALDRAGQIHRRDAGDAAQPAGDAGVSDARQLGAGQTRAMTARARGSADPPDRTA